MWKNIRIAFLLLILAIVAIQSWKDQNQDWKQPIVVLIHPINADHSETSAHYINQLSAQQFTEIKTYLEQQAVLYHRSITVQVILGRTFADSPPRVPSTPSMLNIIWWSLKFRYYAWQHKSRDDPAATVTLYLNYYDPKQLNHLRHSTALEKGRIGLVNIFASTKQHSQNNIVLTHELLHAFGATDKYDLNTGQPLYPIGYANPTQQPLYPQKSMELMAATLPLSAHKSVLPNEISQTMIGTLTAKEIGWAK